MTLHAAVQAAADAQSRHDLRTATAAINDALLALERVARRLDTSETVRAAAVDAHSDLERAAGRLRGCGA